MPGSARVFTEVLAWTRDLSHRDAAWPRAVIVACDSSKRFSFSDAQCRLRGPISREVGCVGGRAPRGLRGTDWPGFSLDRRRTFRGADSPRPHQPVSFGPMPMTAWHPAVRRIAG
jgi:hypothetical protein